MAPPWQNFLQEGDRLFDFINSRGPIRRMGRDNVII